MTARYLFFATILFTSSFALADSFHIGAVLPLTGDSALGGEACLNGMKLAEKKLSKDPQNEISVLAEDNGGSNARTLSAYRKLRDQSRIQAVVAWEDSAGLVLAPVTERDGVTLLVTGVAQETVENRKHAFLYWMMIDREMEAIVNEMNRRGYKRIARVLAQHPGLITMSKEFDRLNNSQISVVANEEISPEDRDFRPQLARIKAKGEVDAILSFVWYGQIGLFAKAVKNAGIQADLVGLDIFEDEGELKLADGGLEGAWFPQIADPLISFRKEYEAAYPGASIYSAGNCYDLVLLAAAAKREGKDFSKYLEQVKDYPGALGPVTASGDHRFIFPILIKEVRAGQFRVAR